VAVASPEEGGGGDHREGDGWSVVLTLSPSDVLPSETGSILGRTTAYSSRSSSSSASSAAANIEIEFTCDEEGGVVRAAVREGQNKGLDDGLLDDLFPGDDGAVNPNVSLSLLTQDEEGETDDGSEEGGREDVTGAVDGRATSNGSIGKPYYWCQVLGGLNFPPPSSSVAIANAEGRDDEGDSTTTTTTTSPFRIQTCTRAVFRQLHRRIRARRTLAAILEFLGKRTGHAAHPLPIHPATRGNEGRASAQPQSIKAKLHSWAEDGKEGRGGPLSSCGSPSARRYVATIKRKSNTLKATVIVDARGYPAEKPPVWSLQNEDGSSGGMSSWGEDHGSVSSLRQQNPNGNNNGGGGGAPPLFDANLHRIECHVNRDLDKFVNCDVENTYDWILIHQLADVVSCWDEVMSAGEAAGGSGNGGGGGRLRKGRDRRLMGFGERSPFFWYRNGL